MRPTRYEGWWHIPDDARHRPHRCPAPGTHLGNYVYIAHKIRPRARPGSPLAPPVTGPGGEFPAGIA